MVHFSVFISILLLSVSGFAQEKAPELETFLGYTFVRSNPSGRNSGLVMQGGSAQFVYNTKDWLGVVLDAGALHNSGIQGDGADTVLANFVLGPRIAWRRSSRITPYAQVLFGGVYATATKVVSTSVPGNLTELPPAPTFRAVTQQFAFAMSAGGGVDIKINKRMSFRPIEIEYFLTRLHNYREPNDDSQNNVRYSAGINFTFGRAY